MYMEGTNMNKLLESKLRLKKYTEMTPEELKKLCKEDIDFIIKEEFDYFLRLVNSIDCLDIDTKLRLFFISRLSSQQLEDCSLGTLKAHQQMLTYYSRLVDSAITYVKEKENSFS